jgi:hypothetical protein
MDKSGEHKSAAITSFSDCVIDLPIILPIFTNRDKLRGFCIRLIHNHAGSSDVAGSAEVASDNDIDLKFEVKEHARLFLDAFHLMTRNS